MHPRRLLQPSESDDGDDLSTGAWHIDDPAQLRRFWPHGDFAALDVGLFDAQVYRRRLPRTQVEGISASSLVVRRPDAFAASPSGDNLVVSAVVEGSVTITGRGRVIEATAGDVFVHRATAFDFYCPDFSRTFRTDSPAPLVMGEAWGGFAPFAVLPRTVLTHAFVRFAGEVLHSVAAGPPLMARDAHALEEALLVLERALVIELVEANTNLLASDEHLQLLINRYIEEHLFDPSLTPSSVARGVGVDRRSAYAAFRGESESIAASIRRRRMEAAMVMLVEDDAVSVMSLAARVGLQNRDTFTRSFKAHHGCTVGEARAHRLPAAPHGRSRRSTG